MMRRAGLGAAGLLLGIAAAGCGGGGGSKAYTLSATQSCLTKAGYQTAVVKNSYLPGSGGDLRVRLTSGKPQLLQPNAPSGRVETGYVFIVFGKDGAEALTVENKALALAVRSFQSQGILLTRAAAKAGVQATDNVFYYSPTGALTKADRTKVAACLH